MEGALASGVSAPTPSARDQGAIDVRGVPDHRFERADELALRTIRNG